MGENYTKQYWENDLIDYAPEHGVERFEVLAGFVHHFKIKETVIIDLDFKLSA